MHSPNVLVKRIKLGNKLQEKGRRNGSLRHNAQTTREKVPKLSAIKPRSILFSGADSVIQNYSPRANKKLLGLENSQQYGKEECSFFPNPSYDRNSNGSLNWC